MQGIEVSFVTHISINYNFTKKSLSLPRDNDDYNVNSQDKFMILDLSNKDFFQTLSKNTII